MHTSSRQWPGRAFGAATRVALIVAVLVAGFVPIGSFSTTPASADPPTSTILPWGDRDFGATNPTPAVPVGEKVIDVSAGEEHSLAVTDAGTVLAWGDDSFGQTDVPAAPAGEKVIAVSA